MADALYHPTTPDEAKRRKDLAPEIHHAFTAFSKAVFAEGALPATTKQIIAVAVAHVTQCPYCIDGHTKAAIKAGATPQELMEAIWVAAEMRAGGAYAHSTLALAAMPHEHDDTGKGASEASATAEDLQLDVRNDPPARRHELIFSTYNGLAAGAAFVLINDHDPKPLYYQFEAEHAGAFTWQYQEEGPQTWRVRIGKA